MKQIDRFLSHLSKLQPIEFLGICTLMGVDVLKEGEPKDGMELVQEIGTKFESCNRKRRRELLKVTAAAIKEGETNGSSTEDSTEST